MKRKLLMVVCIVMCVLCCVGCGSNEDNKENKDENINQSISKNGEKSIRGVWKDDVYINEFAGIIFNLPENWVYATDEEMDNSFENTKDILVSEDDKELIEKGEFNSLDEMMAENIYTGSNIIISYENLSKVVGGSQITAEQYLDISKMQLEAIETFDYEIGEVSTKKLGEQEFLCLTAKIKEYDIEQAYYTKKIDKYMVNIVITSSNSDESIESILANFE